MNCLPNSIAETAEPEPVLVASAGLAHAPPPAVGDLSDWLALMEVVEALCPAWPPRPFTLVGEFRL